MAASNASLPPLAKISMIGIWIETMLYGVNCVMYGLCMCILLRRRKIVSVRWVLVVTSTILFLLCTIHVGASLRQLLDEFAYEPTNVPDHSTTYWVNFTTIPRVLKTYVFDTLLFTQDFILIWRLYVVFMSDWRAIVFPTILAAGCVASTYAASAIPVPPSEMLYDSVKFLLMILGCAFGSTLNVIVTGAIAGRLWWVGRRVGSLTATSTNRFMSSIYVVIESGAISAVGSTVVLAFFASHSSMWVAALDIVAQLAVLMPLLIIVRVGLTSQQRTFQGDSSKTVFAAHDEIIFRVGTPRDQDTLQDLPLHATLSHIESSSAHDSHV